METETSLAVATGARLRELRKASGRTLRDLAAVMGTTPQTVQRLEVATMTVSLEWLEKYCKALDVPVSMVFGDLHGKTVKQFVDDAVYTQLSQWLEDLKLDLNITFGKRE